MDRNTVLSRKQKRIECLHQFRNVSNALAARCLFLNHTEDLVYDIFVLNMANKQVQEKLCTVQWRILQKPSNSQWPSKMVEKAKDVWQHKSRAKNDRRTYCSISGSKENMSQRVCWRCSAGNFTLHHLNRCKEPIAMCNYCGRKFHLEIVCNQEKRTQISNVANPEELAKECNFLWLNATEWLNILNVEGGDENRKPYFLKSFIIGIDFNVVFDNFNTVLYITFYKFIEEPAKTSP